MTYDEVKPRTLFPRKQAHTSYKPLRLYPGIGPVGL